MAYEQSYFLGENFGLLVKNKKREPIMRYIPIDAVNNSSIQQINNITGQMR